ncbi:hypothetical protein [Antrihabitans stalactiti]|uniref:Uncharacterized protein n=1 Tax=Antrihabitans stalactiti TaxID=2584121 RepID=A0A848K4V8_9NOCA|nr:hypothetical protein [Antrihabitans stalactiti]NMN93743.1 hypothetical protein [Antrihabitans stalactiti]
MTALSHADFAANLLAAAASADRVAQVITRFVDEPIEIGPIAIGPGGVCTASAVGTPSKVVVAPFNDAGWDYLVAAPVAMEVSVRIAGRELAYAIDIVVHARIRLVLEAPCTVLVDVDGVESSDVTVNIDPRGVSSRLLGWLGNVGSVVEDRVVAYLNDLFESPAMHAVRRIDVAEMIDRAWLNGAVFAAESRDPAQLADVVARAG